MTPTTLALQMPFKSGEESISSFERANTLRVFAAQLVSRWAAGVTFLRASELGRLWRTMLMALVLARVSEASACVGLKEGEFNTAAGARSWLGRVARENPDAGATCTGTSNLFGFAAQRFFSPESVAEFTAFAKAEDTLVAWVARMRVCRTSDECAQLTAAMLQSTLRCIRCEGVQRAWYASATEDSKRFLAGPEATEILEPWEQVKYPNEHAMGVHRNGRYARVMITTGGQGYWAYYELTTDGWTYLCRNGYWIS